MMSATLDGEVGELALQRGEFRVVVRDVAWKSRHEKPALHPRNEKDANEEFDLEDGGRYRIRTCDPCRVKAVLSR